MERAHAPRSRLLWAAELFAFGGFALAVCWPAVRTLVHGIAHPDAASLGGDRGLYVYMIEIQCRRLAGGGGGLWEGGFFYPLQAQSLLFTEPAWGAALLAFPAWLLAGSALAAVNLTSLGAMFACWFAVRAFVRGLGGALPAAWFAAFAVGTSASWCDLFLRPFFWTLFLIPWIALELHRWFRSPGVCRGAALGFLASLLIWSSCHLAVMGAVVLVPFAWWSWRDAGYRRPGIAAALCAVVPPAVSAAWVLIPLAQALFGNGFSRPLHAQSMGAGTLASFFDVPWTWSSRQLVSVAWLPAGGVDTRSGMAPVVWLVATLLGGIELLAVIRTTSVRRLAVICGVPWMLAIVVALLVPATLDGSVVNRGLTVLGIGVPCALVAVLGFCGPAGRRGPARILIGIALCGALFSLGPLHHVGAEVVVTPAVLLARIPGISGIRASTRWAVLLAFGLPTAVGLIGGAQRSRWREVLLASGCALGFADMMQPGFFSPVTFDVRAPDFSGRPVDTFLRDQPGPGAVLELPLVPEGGYEPVRMLCRLIHQRPLVNGQAGFTPQRIEDALAAAQSEFRTTGQVSDRAIAALRRTGPRFIVFHLGMIDPSLRGRLPPVLGALRRVAVLDEGATLVFEDPAPTANLGG